MSAEGQSPSDTAAVNGRSMQETLVNNAAAAVNTIQNHPVTQNAKEAAQNLTDSVANGPVAESVKNQTALTSEEFSGLADSRNAPPGKAATGETLTQYHSFFYTLLSWKHPRATGIAFATNVIFIFASRYLPILPWAFKLTYITLGVTALAEIAGRFVMGQGLTSTIRPRRYFKIPKETLESSLDDLEQLINFFVIEFQRILFAENPIATVATFTFAFVSYYLIKIVPLWGMALITTCVVYLTPLVYVTNKEFIDGQLNNASDIIATQATQVKDIAGQHAGNALETAKAYTGDYAAKAQELVGTARQKIPSTSLGSGQTAKTVNDADFPAPPQTEFPSTADHSKPVATAGGETVAVA